ncbi:hypothetical protein [Pseudoalteromonas ulvae]|uniref:Uncharacterized protein n=1 Tax=Pseudoalteromonas ulvae TaxID=107327 RepID=A0A244CUK0_PSEDV|nr:hypothetical protein [Pseudoalteromonas ulvae]OUL59293.1 hypothetical protein B1199_03215 [Pseudoalteromonas ulvae]
MDFINYIKENTSWIFSGIGVYIISAVIGLIIFIFVRKKLSINKVKQSNIIAGGDVVGRDKKG